MRLCLLLTCSVALALPLRAHAAADGIHRCVGADGGSIYTDRPCEELGAVDRKPAPPAVETRADDIGFTRRDCSRRTDTLLFDLRRALEASDVNQIASLYHWPGISRRNAHAIMDRLERLGSRPLSSVELVFPDSTPVLDAPDAFPSGTPSEDPVAVKIEQTMADEVVPRFSESLQLVRHADCWWVRF